MLLINVFVLIVLGLVLFVFIWFTAYPFFRKFLSSYQNAVITYRGVQKHILVPQTTHSQVNEPDLQYWVPVELERQDYELHIDESMTDAQQGAVLCDQTIANLQKDNASGRYNQQIEDLIEQRNLYLRIYRTYDAHRMEYYNRD